MISEVRIDHAPPEVVERKGSGELSCRSARIPTKMLVQNAGERQPRS
jgi:hypothetical protein